MSELNFKMENVTIGSDIEYFIQGPEQKIVSAEPFIMGTKYEPYYFDSPNDKFSAISLDNVLAEICIPPVGTNNMEQFIAGIQKSRDFVQSLLPEGYSCVSIPSAVLDSEYLQSENAMVFGCEPDYNVWIRKANKKPNVQNKNLRSSGFHVHVGYEDPTNEKTEAIIKAFDLFLGIPSILLEPVNERRQLYGKAGAFRFKDYGCEYRVLSGYFANPPLSEWVYNNAVEALHYVNKNGIEPIEQVGERIQSAINNSDVNECLTLIKGFNIQY